MLSNSEKKSLEIVLKEFDYGMSFNECGRQITVEKLRQLEDK